MYDPDEQRILVIEAWYRAYEHQWITINKLTGSTEDHDSREDAMALQAADPDHITAIRRVRRKIRMATVIPAIFKTLEDGPSPYDNDDEHYPFVPYIAERKRNKLFGIVRDLKDPQRVENKRLSQAMDLSAKFGNLRLQYEETAVRDPSTLSDPHSTAPIPRARGTQPIMYLVPPVAELVQLHTQLGLQMQSKMREVSGINTDLLGERGVAESGIARARRQAQGQLIATPYFTALARTRILIGQRLARRIQQRFTMDEYVRLTNDLGAPVVLHVNPAVTRNMSDEDFKTYRDSLPDDRPRILRDVSALKYDVTISDGPSTPTRPGGCAAGRLAGCLGRS